MSLSALLPIGSVTLSSSSALALLPLTNSQGASSPASQSASATSSASAQLAADTYTPSGGASGTTASDFNTAVQDGVQLVEWMESQSSLAGSAQSDPAAVAASTGTGEALAAQFSSDLNALGADLGQSTGSTAQPDTAAAIDSALSQAISADTNNGAGHYSLSISSSSLTELAGNGAGVAAATGSALKIQLTNTGTGGEASGTGSSDLALEYSTADVVAGAGTANGAAVNAATSSFSTLSETKNASGVSVLAAELSSASVTGADGGNGSGTSDGTNAGAALAANSDSFSMESLQGSGRHAAREAAAMVRQWQSSPYGAEPAAAALNNWA